jgi:hypothetical protein
MRFKYHGPLGLWDADTGRATAWLDKDETVDRSCIQLSPDGRWLAAQHALEGDRFRWSIYCIATGGPPGEQRPEGAHGPSGGRFSSDSRWFAYADREAGEDSIRVPGTSPSSSR